MSKDTSEPGLVDDLIAEFRESPRRNGLNHSALLYAQSARHFVVWLENEGARLADADDALLHRFARHSCECAGFVDRKWPAPTPRQSASGAVRFVRFPGSARSCSPSRRGGRRLPSGGSVRAIPARPRLPAVHRRYLPAHVHSPCRLAAPVQDPVGPDRRRRGGSFRRSRLPMPGTPVASSSQAVAPRAEGRGQSCSLCRLPGRRRCPGRRTCVPAPATGPAPGAVPAVAVAGAWHRGAQRRRVHAHPAFAAERYRVRRRTVRCGPPQGRGPAAVRGQVSEAGSTPDHRLSRLSAPPRLDWPVRCRTARRSPDSAHLAPRGNTAVLPQEDIERAIDTCDPPPRSASGIEPSCCCSHASVSAPTT